MREKAIALFYSGAQGAMRTAGIEILDTTNLVPDDVVNAVAAFEEAAGMKLEKMEKDSADVLDEFQQWLAQYEPEKLYTIDTLALTIPLKGGSSITLGVKLGSTNIPAVLAGLKAEVKTLMQQNIEAETAGVLTNNTKPASDTQGNVSDGEETWGVTKIKKAYAENGEIRLRIFGGRWTQYGVPMYPDEMEKYRFHETLGTGEFDPPFKMKATAFIKDGKPKRITKLEKIG